MIKVKYLPFFFLVALLALAFVIGQDAEENSQESTPPAVAAASGTLQDSNNAFGIFGLPNAAPIVKDKAKPGSPLEEAFNNLQSARSFIGLAKSHPNAGGVMYALAVLNTCKDYTKAQPQKLTTGQHVAARNISKYCDLYEHERAQMRREIQSLISREGDPYLGLIAGPLTAKTVEDKGRLAEMALQQADPLLFLNMYGLTGNADSKELRAAWLLAACDLGLNCKSNSFALLLECLTSNFCGDGDAESIARQEWPDAADYAVVTGYRQAILSAAQDGSMRALFSRLAAGQPL